jgi:hypothetical protein
LKKTIHLFILIFYTFGTFCLPMGDFAMIKDLPQMYRHCKATEDKDLTPIDFITDHLINIDGIFDKHENGDEQKPHSPIQIQHHGQTIIYFVTYFSFSSSNFYPIEIKTSFYSEKIVSSDFFGKILRPPIFSL